MPIGDSLGPGGIMRAFRNAPALAQVARNAAEVARDPYIFNYTNPAPIEALAMRTAAPSVKSFGLCSCAAHASSPEWLARQAGVKPEQIAMPPVVAGINHCASIQSLRLVDGTDAMPLVLAEREASRSSAGRSRPTGCCPTAGSTGRSSSRRCSGSRSPTRARSRA